METFVQWATILSPIIAVIIALVTGYYSSKSTREHISALEDSTAKQIESIKMLAKLQAEITTIQMDKDIWELRFLIESNTIEMKDLYKDDANILNLQHDAALGNNSNRHKEKKELLLKQDFYLKQQDNLKGHIKRFEQIKKELELI